MRKGKPKLNWEVIASNIAEAGEELQRLEQQVAQGSLPDEIEFEIAMQHAFHHLNWAWNIRPVTNEEYGSTSQEDFVRWGSYPTDLPTMGK
jgi:hypothetical protein